jgi:hypothetical protein
VTFPTDAKLLNRAREKLVRLAKLRGVDLRQSYARVGKLALIQHQRYADAKQFKPNRYELPVRGDQRARGSASNTGAAPPQPLEYRCRRYGGCQGCFVAACGG